MKKILALVLAVSMMATTAFAVQTALTDNLDMAVSGNSAIAAANPGDTLAMTAEGFSQLLSTAVGASALDQLPSTYYFTSEYFSISAKKFTKGANLVEKVAFSDDDGELQIVLKQNYSLKTPNIANLVIDTLKVKAKKSIVNSNGVQIIAKNAEYGWNTKEGNAIVTAVAVGYTTVELDLASSTTLGAGQMNKMTNPGNETPYNTVYFSGGELTIEGRAYKGNEIFVKVTTAPNDFEKELLKVESNFDADMRFNNFTTNGLPSNFKVMLEAEEDEFIYEINAAGKLVESKLKWSTDDYAWVGKIRSTTSYVISDIKLTAAPAAEGEPTETPEDPNPSTGANDVVGIAAALAVVSLVAAGAVSLKK